MADPILKIARGLSPPARVMYRFVAPSAPPLRGGSLLSSARSAGDLLLSPVVLTWPCTHRPSMANNFEQLLQRCEQEPIQIPGSIQAHGTLVACDDRLVVRYAANNLGDFCGVSVADALGRPIGQLLGEDLATRLSQNLPATAASPLVLEWSKPDGLLDIRAHRHAGRVLLEIEESTPTSVDFYALITDALERVVRVSETAELLEEAIRFVHQMTGYGRVMVYRFRPNWDGEVVAEISPFEPPRYLGLRFPASDIPRQARELYERNWLRMIPDIMYRPVPILSHDPDPLDLTHSDLRSVSPIHIKYLENMGVAASMSISLVVGGSLWGLIACHHSEPRHLPQHTRRACELFARQLSTHLMLTLEQSNRRRYASQDEFLRSIRSLHERESGVASFLLQSASQLLELVGATGLIFSLEGSTGAWGQVPPPEAIPLLMDYLDEIGLEETWCTHSLEAEAPHLAGLRESAAGILAISLTSGDRLLFLRHEAVKTVAWGGNPTKSVSVDDKEGGVLSPRRSFEEWKQTVHGQSDAWTPLQIKAAKDLRQNLIEMLLVRTAVDAAHQRGRSETAAVVLHDIGNALTGITGRAVSLRSFLDDKDIQDHLRRLISFVGDQEEQLNEALGEGKGNALLHLLKAMESHQATTRSDALESSDRLMSFLDHAKQLLDLNRLYTRQPADRSLLAVSPAALIRDLVAMTGDFVRARGGTVVVDIAPGLPNLRLDRSKVMQVLLHLMKNAYEAMQKDDPPLQINVSVRLLDSDLIIEIADNGVGFSSDQRTNLFDNGYSTKGRESGIGLAGSRRVVESFGGKLYLESEGPGRGARAVVIIPASEFDHELS
jgi:two-component system, chemotaxis family, sensor kinase Cph1